MRHIYLALLACVTLSTRTLLADPIGSAEALRIAQQRYSAETASLLKSGSFPEFKLVYVGMEEGIETPSKLRSSHVEDALLYMYNVGDGQGFVIVSGEDQGKRLLGISDQGSLPETGLSGNMKNLMSTYIRYVKALRSGLVMTPVEGVANNPVLPSAVIPLIKTEWRDDGYYSESCPVIDDIPCFAGAEATAMAQIMNYYQYPKQGIGRVNYKNPGSTVVISADFSRTTYDWANMPAKLDEGSSWEEIEAVSTLIFHCGAAAYTDYERGLSATGEDVRSAFVTHFGYDKNIQLYDRAFFSDKEWGDLLRAELAARRPVYYEGGSGENNQTFKWAFVCDGYNKDGLFHLNTGLFGGGYFELGAIYNGLYTYNEGQSMITGIRKPSDESSSIALLGVSSLGTRNVTSIKLGDSFPVSYSLFNLGHHSDYVHALWAFEEDEPLECKVDALSLDTIKGFQSGNNVQLDFPDYKINFSDSTAVYHLYVVGGRLGDRVLKPVRTVNHPYDYIVAEVKDGRVTFSQARNALTADPVEVRYDAEGKIVSFEVTFHNKQVTDFRGTAGIYVRIPGLSIDDYSWEANDWLEISAGKSRKVSYTGDFNWNVGDTLAVVATYQRGLNEFWEPAYTDIAGSYRTFALKIDGSLAVSNETIGREPATDLDYSFDAISGQLILRSDVDMKALSIYSYAGLCVWESTIQGERLYNVTLPVQSGQYILKVATEKGLFSGKIYKK